MFHQKLIILTPTACWMFLIQHKKKSHWFNPSICWKRSHWILLNVIPNLFFISQKKKITLHVNDFCFVISSELLALFNYFTRLPSFYFHPIVVNVLKVWRTHNSPALNIESTWRSSRTRISITFIFFILIIVETKNQLRRPSAKCGWHRGMRW